MERGLKILGCRDLDPVDTLFEQEKEEKKRNIEVSVPDWIYQNTSDVIEKILDLEDRNTLKAILMLKHPETGIEATEYELKQYVCDLPYINISVFSLYLEVKKQKEAINDLLDNTYLKLSAVYEEKIKNQWFAEKEQKLRTTLGTISKNQIEMEIAKDKEAMETLTKIRDKIRELSFKEEMLSKIVKLLDLRSYEIQTLLKIETGLNK